MSDKPDFYVWSSFDGSMHRKQDVGFTVSYPTWDVSRVDASAWRPDAEIARAFLMSDHAGSSVVGEYMYPDGKDDGYMPLPRYGNDVTEVEARMQEITQEAKRRDDDSKAVRKQVEQIAQAMSDLATAGADDSDPGE